MVDERAELAGWGDVHRDNAGTRGSSTAVAAAVEVAGGVDAQRAVRNAFGGRDQAAGSTPTALSGGAVGGLERV